MVAWLGAAALGGAVATAAALAPAPGTVHSPDVLASTVQGPTIAVVIIGAQSTAMPADGISPPA